MLGCNLGLHQKILSDSRLSVFSDIDDYQKNFGITKKTSGLIDLRAGKGQMLNSIPLLGSFVGQEELICYISL
jgi:hypothetical protein